MCPPSPERLNTGVAGMYIKTFVKEAGYCRVLISDVVKKTSDAVAQGRNWIPCMSREDR